MEYASEETRMVIKELAINVEGYLVEYLFEILNKNSIGKEPEYEKFSDRLNESISKFLNSKNIHHEDKLRLYSYFAGLLKGISKSYRKI